jgi:hypothetical protein
VFSDEDGNLVAVDYGRSDKDHVNTFIAPTTGREMEFKSKLVVRAELPDGETFTAWQCMNFMPRGTMYKTDNGRWMLLANGFSCVVYRQAEDDSDKYREVYLSIPKENRDNLTRGTRDLVDGILQINAGKKLLSPDANSTIRLTYGNVKAYEPRDGVTYHFYTTLEGVMQKEDPTNTEFIVPQRLKDLYAAKDYGTYANAKGELPTCFITNNDITGGNSGSPVLDAYGNLIGLAFDGNGEAMSGDIDFEENLQRCICLDSRYMLFVIDKYANAQNLIDEMDIVR